jgi:hypothetical protein
MIPPIWFIELARIDQANARRQNNATEVDPLDGFLNLGESLLDDPNLNLKGSLKIVVSHQIISTLRRIFLF